MKTQCSHHLKELSGTSLMFCLTLLLWWEPNQLWAQPSGSIDIEGITLDVDLLSFVEGGQGSFTGSGSAQFAFEDQSIEIVVPEGGLVLAESGNGWSLESFEVDVSADFSLYGMELSVPEDDPLSLKYDLSSSNFCMHGEVDLEIESQTLEAFLGDEENPGLEIQNGSLQTLEIGVATDISLGGFEFKISEDNPFTVTYDASSDTYTLTGEAELDSLWDTIIDLGNEGQPGIEIIDNQWNIEDLAVEIDSLDLGFAELNELRVEYQRSQSDIVVDITLDVSIPELEIEVEGDVRVDNGKITDIFIDFEAEGTSEGLEILDTGISIADLNVSLSNLDQPANLIMSGGIGLEFGGQLSLAGRTVTLAYIEGDVYIDSDELQLSDSIYYGAYQNDSGHWKSIIFEGDAVLDLNWAHGEYSLSGDVRLPTDYGIKISETLEFSKESIVLDAKAEVRVPDGIPLIGGDNLGSIEAAMLIDMKDSSESFAAGGVKIDLLFTDEEAGIKYKFHNGDIDFVSGGDIKDIKNDIKDAESASDTITRHLTLDIPEGATSFVVDMNWRLENQVPVISPTTGELILTTITNVVPEIFVTASGFVLKEDGSIGESAISLHPLSLENGVYSAFVDDLFTVAIGTDGAMFSSEGFILSEVATGQEIVFEALAAGEVTISLTYDRDLDSSMVIDPPSIVVYYDYPDPSISIDNIELSETNSKTTDGVTTLFSGTVLPIEMSYFTDPAFASGTHIKLYVDDNNSGYNGHSIAGKISYTNNSVTDPTTHTYDWTISNTTGDPNDEFYIYARINNHNQSIVYTDYFGPYRIEPAVFGQVYNGFPVLPLNGFRVYLDANKNGVYDSKTDPSTITDSEGFYALEDVDEGSISIGVVVPKGYVSNDSEIDYVSRTYVTGNTVNVDFNLTQLTSISGVVFTDTDGDGIQDPGEIGFFGVTLYLDENGDENWTPGMEPSTTSDIEGNWTFHDLNVNNEYKVRIYAFPSQITTQVNNFTVNTSNQAAPRSHEQSMFPRVEHPQFGGYAIPFFPSATEEVSDRRYMQFASTYFNGESEDHHTDADPDGDGFINYEEWMLGFDPTTVDGGDILAFERAGEKIFRLTIEAVDRQRYVIQESADLEQWIELDTFRANGTGPVKLTFEKEDVGAQSFFRVLINP